MSIVLMGSTSGSCTLQEQAVAGSSVITLPVGTGTAVVNGVNSAIVHGTAVASTSGTSIDFTGIPSWVKRVTVMLQGVSLNAAASIAIRLGTSGGVVATGYVARQANIVASAANGANETTGFVFGTGNVSSDLWSGSVVINNLTGNNWIAAGACVQTAGTTFTTFPCGSIALGAALDRVRITTTAGTASFNAGTINILYE